MIKNSKETFQTNSQQVRADMDSFLTSVGFQKQFFANEKEFQVSLAFHLDRTQHYQQIHLEYSIPSNILPDYVWKEDNLYFDIVVETKNGQLIPIELKYKTTNKKGWYPEKTERFGALVENCVKNQGARDLGAYSFWKDVRRLELLKKKYEKVELGFAVLLTNDEGYWTLPDNNDVAYENFSVRDGITSKIEKHWKGKENDPNFNLEKEYPVKWSTQTGYYRSLIVQV